MEGICGVFVVVLNLLASMKSVILESYCFMGRIIKEFPLSARVTMASFYLSFVFMLLTIFAPGCVLCVRWGYFLYQGTDTFGCQFPVRLLGLWRGGGRCMMAVSASRARFRIQYVGLECKLCLGPFSSNVISCSENVMSVVFITLG